MPTSDQDVDVTIQRRTSLTGLVEVHTSGMSRRWRLGVVIVSALVLVAAGAVLLIQHRHDDDVIASDRGALSSDQYDTAIRLARSEIAKDHAMVSMAVAYVVAGKIRTPNLSTGCTSGRLLVLSLVGEFPNINVSPAPGAPTGPDMWVTVKADPTSGEACLAGVSLGRFTAPAGSADLTPAL
jgi:hypothetical protein